ncbi:MAG: oligosaccharide flippase family protein [Patescibacteria group bacterium]
MQQNDTLKKNSIKSIFSLFFQSGYAAILGFVANFVLSIFLTPATFGIYITVLSLIAFLNYFSDIGLAASLIQKKEIDDEDIKTVFTVQQLLITSLIILGLFSTSFVQNFYKLEPNGVYLFWALLISFYISSLKTIPSILLEREINFQKIVTVQVVENTIFYISVTIGALLHFGLMSFTVSVLLRAIVGLVLMYRISPWKIKIGISFGRLRKLLHFGFSFQSSSLLALFKDDLMTLFLSKLLGFEAMGYIGWAKKWAEAPIRIIMDNLSKVLFPVLSRVQTEKDKLQQVIEKMLYYQTMILAPTTVGIALLMPIFVKIIPKYQKWEIALPMLFLFCISAFLSSFSTPFINLFNALGKASLSLVFMIVWTVLTWVLTPLLTLRFGIMGFALTQVILSATCFVVMWQARRFVPFHVLRIVSPFILAAGAMAGGVLFFTRMTTPSPLTFVTAGLLGVILYLSVLYFVFRKNPVQETLALFIKHV